MKKFFFTALVGAMMISCNRDNDDTGSVTNDTSILPTKIISSYKYREDIETTYTYNGNKLVKESSKYGNDIFYTYTGDLITSKYGKGWSRTFTYDSNGNLISEKLMRGKNSIDDITYTINGSTVTAQSVAKNYSQLDGVLSSISTSTITYTLDTQKRPIKSVEVSETKDTTGNITFQENKTTTIQYANHHSPLKNIVGFDKLNYSDFTDHDDEAFTNTISYMKEESKVTQYHGGSNVVTNNVYETKHEYTINSNNYPIKEQEYYRSNSSGTYAKDRGQTIIEYNK